MLISLIIAQNPIKNTLESLQSFRAILTHPSPLIKDLSAVFTNDLKQIETKGFLSEVAMIQNALMFVFALSYGIFLSPLTMLMFVIASCVPIIISQLFAKKIESSSAAWSANNSLYTGKLSDCIDIR